MKQPKCITFLAGTTHRLMSGVHAVLVLGALAVCSGSVQSSQKALQSFPFWQASQGFWVSDNTYFNHAMDYNLRAYNSIVKVELQDGEVTETEYKFYPPSKLAMGYGAGKIGPDQGIEVVTVMKGVLLDDAGTVRISSVSPDYGSSALTTIEILNRDTAVRTTKDSVGSTDSYRMLITMPTATKRYVANFGLIADPKTVGAVATELGDLRGFSLFRGSRIDEKDFKRVRAALRQSNHVTAIVRGDSERHPTVTLLQQH